MKHLELLLGTYYHILLLKCRFYSQMSSTRRCKSKINHNFKSNNTSRAEISAGRKFYDKINKKLVNKHEIASYLVLANSMVKLFKPTKKLTFCMGKCLQLKKTVEKQKLLCIFSTVRIKLQYFVNNFQFD